MVCAGLAPRSNAGKLVTLPLVMNDARRRFCGALLLLPEEAGRRPAARNGRESVVTRMRCLSWALGGSSAGSTLMSASNERVGPGKGEGEEPKMLRALGRLKTLFENERGRLGLAGISAGRRAGEVGVLRDDLRLRRPRKLVVDMVAPGGPDAKGEEG